MYRYVTLVYTQLISILIVDLESLDKTTHPMDIYNVLIRNNTI